jgi:hypothetical protein
MLDELAAARVDGTDDGTGSDGAWPESASASPSPSAGGLPIDPTDGGSHG